MYKQKALTIIVFIVLVIGTFAIIKNDHSSPIVQANNQSKSIANQLNQIIDNHPALKHSIAGVSIRSATTGELIYEHNSHIRLRPASNMKLLTAAAALSRLGEDYSFETEVYTDGIIERNILHGNLYLKGKGDPTLLPSDINEMASKIKQKGISMIEGSIIGDDSWYDDVRYSRDLNWSDEHAYYGAQISALTASPDKDFDAGTVIVEVKPASKPGKKPIINVVPQTNYISISNQAITVDDKEEHPRLEITREHGTNKIIIDGSISINSKREREWIAVWNPTSYATDLFEKSLTRYGIRWTGIEGTGRTPSNATKLVTHSSIPLSNMIVPFMKLSNNTHGEVLMKELGKVEKGEGTWEKGIEVVKEELEKFNVNSKETVIRDGSGISHVNLLTANQLSTLLYNIQTEKWFPTFLESLPVAGNGERMVGGTLGYRMNDISNSATVRAKTGTIATVSSLSGYVDSKNGKKYVFSILVNNLLDSSEGKQLEDQLVKVLAEQ